MLLALPVVWSVHHPSVLGDIIHSLDLDLAWDYVFPLSFQGKLLFPSIFRVSSTWNHPDKDHFLYSGWCHWHANGWSASTIVWYVIITSYSDGHHRNAIRWKYHKSSTIVVLNLWWLGNFPLSMYHLYHSTSFYGSGHTSRLTVVYYGTTYLHAGYSPYVPIKEYRLGTRVLPVGKAGTVIVGLGNLMAKLAFR